MDNTNSQQSQKNDLQLPVTDKRSEPKNDIDLLKDSGVQFMDENPEPVKPAAPTDTTTPTEPSIVDLEQDFLAATSNTPTPKPTQPKPAAPHISGVLSEIEVLISKLAQKIETKKTAVRADIEKLRTTKEGIAQEIAEIKELEETQTKLQEKKDAYQKISGEIENVEQEAEQELSSF